MSIAPITYTRTFSHKDWIDFVDSVQAGGTNGINIRMHAIEAEFDTLSQVISAINAALQTLGAQPPQQTITVNLIPAFVTNGTTGWLLEGTNAVKGNTSAASGIMPLNLPDGVTITQLQAAGKNIALNPTTGAATPGPGAISIKLQRTGTTNDTVANISPPSGSAQTFNQTQAATASFAVVDLAHFTYYIAADVAGANTSDTVEITQLQITYQTP